MGGVVVVGSYNHDHVWNVDALPAPGDSVLRLAYVAANATLASNGVPGCAARCAASAPLNASPAPVVSTTFAAGAGTR